MQGVSGGSEPPEPVTDGTSQRGRCVYWLNTAYIVPRGDLTHKQKAPQKQGCYLI
ncbi:hypothetical protein CRJUMX01_1510004 [Escherichia coli]|nr:hypothetical protein CRJUMX01_1510004 [Escherichia coli]